MIQRSIISIRKTLWQCPLILKSGNSIFHTILSRTSMQKSSVSSHSKLCAKVVSSLNRYPFTMARRIESRFCESGTADILCCYKGLFVGFEVKVGKDVLRKKQKLFKRKTEEALGKVFVIQSVHEAFECLKNLQSNT